MATRFVKASYQEVIDLHTESGHVTAIGVHTPTGDTPRKMFRGYFDQYKKYRYAGARITFAPVAKLPADPLSVSYEAGEPTIDPRDLANPILVHGCHGDDMGTILNKLYGDNSSISDGLDGLDVSNTASVPSGVTSPYYAAMERLYYKALTDRTWKKAGIQRGFSKSGLRPLLYTLATNHQIMPTALLQDGGAHVNVSNQIVVNGGVPTSEYDDAEAVTGGYELENPVDPTQIQFFTPHLTRLGWLDTRNVITVDGLGTTDQNISSGGSAALTGANELVQSGLVSQVNYVELPKLFMLCILLPPAYKTEMYFRAIITHFFQFKDFRGISFMPEQTGVPSYFNANDDLFDADTFDDIDAGDVPNDDSSGGDDSGGGSLGGEPANFKITNLLNNTLVFMYRFIKNGSLVSGSSGRFKLAYNEESDVDISMGGNDAVRFKVINYNTSITDLDQYLWNDGTTVNWKINSSTTAVSDVEIADGETFTGRYDNLNNYATLS